MFESPMTLTADERDYLTTLLETALKDKRVEEHRTRSPGYREHVLQQEAIISSLLDKLRPTPVEPAV
jgi:hypothetical protein